MLLDLCPGVKELECEFTASVCQERATSLYIKDLYYQLLREIDHWHIRSYSRIMMLIDSENLSCHEMAKDFFETLLQDFKSEVILVQVINMLKAFTTY